MEYGRYQVIKELGGGAMGMVYLAHDPHIGRDVALKVLRRERVTEKTLLERFRREAKAIGLLSHPNIVMVYDVGEDQGTVFIVMEFVEGKPLSELIDEGGLSQEEIVKIAVQVAEALDYAHQRGIVHRDIKPSNIIVQLDGQVKITDFGIARLEDPSLTKHTQTGEVLGTPAYMSPEQALGEEADRRSDLFSLGVILFELSAGRRPFSGKSLASVLAAIIREEPPEPSTFNPDLPPEFCRIIKKCLNKSPDKRYQAGKDLAEALGGLTRKEPVKAVLPRVSGEKRKWPLLFLVSILVALAVGALLWVFTRQIPSVSIMVQSEPEGAEIYVDDDANPKGVTPRRLTLEQGVHRIKVLKKHYHPWNREIPLEKDVVEPLMAKLKPILGILPILSDPPGAEVYVGEHYQGKTGNTPMEIELPLGTHQVQVRKEGYHPWEKEIPLEGHRIEPLRVSLELILAVLRIVSLPGSKIYVDGDYQGKTGDIPLRISLPLGTHKVRVTKPGYRPWNDVVKLSEEKEYPLKVKLQQELATLQVQSIPTNADLYVNGDRRGRTPISLNLPLGAYEVLCKKEGYHPWEASVRLERPRQLPVNIRLSPIVVFLQIESTPSGAEVYVDNVGRGQTPVKVEVSPTKHRLRLTKHPLKDWERSIDLSGLKEKSLFSLDINLRTGKYQARY